MIQMKYTALVTILAVAVTFYFSARVGIGRAKLGIDAPAMTGNPTFDRTFRVHANTVEQIVLFLPVLWLSTAVVGDVWAAAIGVLWVIGRLIYARGYVAEADKRGPGMLVTLASTAVLSLVSIWGIIQALTA
ncbi:MAG TPA: MAPEG family protein [Gammaproteobacteria bacterium]